MDLTENKLPVREVYPIKRCVINYQAFTRNLGLKEKKCLFSLIYGARLLYAEMSAIKHKDDTDIIMGIL
jgi:hypothetical protein